MSEKLFSAVLPLLGTWVGTVLHSTFPDRTSSGERQHEATDGRGAEALKNTRLDQVMSTTMVTVKDKTVEKVKDVLKTLRTRM